MENFIGKRINNIQVLTGINSFIYYKNLNLLLLGESHDFDYMYNLYYITDYLIDLLLVKDINLYIEESLPNSKEFLEIDEYIKDIESSKKDPFEYFKSIDSFNSPMDEMTYHLRGMKYYPVDIRYDIYGVDILSVICSNLSDYEESQDFDYSLYIKGEIYAKENFFELFLYVSGFGEEYKYIYMIIILFFYQCLLKIFQ